MTDTHESTDGPHCDRPVSVRHTSLLVVFVCLLSLPVAFLADPLSRSRGMPILFFAPWSMVLCLGWVAVVRLITHRETLRGCGCLIVAGLVAGWLYVQGASICVSRPEGRSCECRGNLLNIGLALRLYASAHAEVWPPSDHWCDLVLEMGPFWDRYQFLCPDGPEEGCDYAFNGALAGRKSVEAPDTVLVFETESQWNACGGRELLLPKPRHPDGYNFAFADGSVRAVPAEEVDGLRWVP